MQPIFFSNPANIIDSKLIEMTAKWIKYHNDIDDKTLLNQIDYTLARDYYEDAKIWLKLFSESEWWRDDLK